MEGAVIVFIAVLIALFVIFKLFKISLKVFVKLLINSALGALILFIFNYIFVDLLNLKFFEITINYLTAFITGLLGVPGVILILLFNLIF